MAGPASLRLFIALWPPATVRDAVAAWQSQWQWPPAARLVDPPRLHVTLHFLGAVPASAVPDLNYVLREVPMQAFALKFGRPEVWPQGIAVLRPEASPIALRSLHGRIGLALAKIGMPTDERSFRPHITLARRAKGALPPAAPAGIEWECRHGFVLAQSFSSGRNYEVLKTFGAGA